MSQTVDQKTIAFAHRLADAAGDVIRPYFRKVITVSDKAAAAGKPAFDPVTEADRNAEAAIRSLIKRECPGDGIEGEEMGREEGTSGRLWVLDPIDGTRAFITGRHTWGTLIALVENGKPRLGIIDQPVLRERFLGHAGGAVLIVPDGTQALRTRGCASLAEAVVSSTHPWGYFEPAERARFEALCRRARLSYFGGDCYGYALLAMGFVDLIVEAQLKSWDVAALVPVIENAGGVITDWEGRPCHGGGRIVAAGDRRVHAEALALLSP